MSQGPPEFEPANLQNPYADLTREKLREGLAAVELPRAPGEKFEYSNLGAGLLGLALARRTGLSYEAAIQKRLCEPLGLNDTSIKIADKYQPRFARPYDPDLKLVSQWDLPTLAGAGALRSTAIDLMKLVRANIDRDKGPLHEAITRSHIVHGKLEGIPGTIALAWHVALDKTTYWHSGQTGGHHCFVAFNRPLKIGTVILASGDTLRIDGLGFNLIRLLAGVTVEPMTFPKIIKVDPAKFDRYAGRYQLAPTFFLKVRRDKDRLLVRATDQEEFQVYPIAETEFVYKVVEAKITFVVDDDGTVNKLILHQNGRNMPGRRVEANDAAKQAN